MHDDLLPCARVAAVLAQVAASAAGPAAVDWAIEAGVRPPRRVQREVAALPRAPQGIVDGFVLLRACTLRSSGSVGPARGGATSDAPRPLALRARSELGPAQVGEELLTGLRRVRAGGAYIELTWLGRGTVRASALARLAARLRWRRGVADHLDGPASATAALAVRLATLAALGLAELDLRRAADAPDVAVIRGLVRPGAPLA